MRIFATSDQHFFHKNIIKHTKRPFSLDESGVYKNAEHMINKYNEVVETDDLVYFLGDLSFNPGKREEEFKEIIKNLKGNKILIRGNHDHQPDQFFLDLGFLAVKDYVILGDKFLCHYPCYESQWTKQIERKFIKVLEKSGCKTLIHGHVHDKDSSLWVPDGYNRINVCVDFPRNDYKPVQII